MYRGTTPTLIFEIETELDLQDMKQIWVTIRDSRGFLHTFNIEQVTIDNENKTINLFLTQQETFKIARGKGQVQIRFLTYDDIALVTEIADIEIDDTLRGGIIE